MINIDFPQDPSKLKFQLDKSISSAYLLAKAAKHYGPANINAVFVGTGAHPLSEDERNRSMHRILDEIGLPDVVLLTAGDYLKNKTATEIMAAYVEWIKVVDPAYDDDATEIMDIDVALIVLTFFIHMGRIDHALVPIQSPDPMTFVTSLNDGGNITKNIRTVMEIVSRPDTRERVGIWSPLQQYTDQDIIESAAEEGLLDIVTLARTCEHSRPLHCGVCPSCMERRIIFISSDIEDNTQYEYK